MEITMRTEHMQDLSTSIPSRRDALSWLLPRRIILNSPVLPAIAADDETPSRLPISLLRLRSIPTFCIVNVTAFHL
jgi:hypothetical protein